MSKINSWYVLAKEDKRYRYDFNPVLHRSHVFYDLEEAKRQRIKRQPFYKAKLIILKRTCQTLGV